MVVERLVVDGLERRVVVMLERLEMVSALTVFEKTDFEFRVLRGTLVTTAVAVVLRLMLDVTGLTDVLEVEKLTDGLRAGVEVDLR